MRIIAQGDGFSDGEQHYLPVLTDKQYVTTTLPFTQHEPGTLQLDLKQLFKGKGIERPSLTIEYTNNPAWILVQRPPLCRRRQRKECNLSLRRPLCQHPCTDDR